MNRRNFLQKSGAFIAASGLSLTAFSGCTSSSQRRLTEIGLQVSTIREPLKEDWRKALEEVAEIGYDTLELGGAMGDLSITEFKKVLADLELYPLAGGASMAGFKDSTQKLIDDALQMGKKYLICYWPWVDSPENKSLDDWKAMAESLNKIGEQVTQAGLGFTYHNHDLEFKITGGKIPYDIILDTTDPDLVGMEIDLYWIEKGNQKSIPYFEKYPGRFPLWHIKDMDNTAERSFACVGQGIIHFPTIFAKAELAGMKHVFVEHDRPKQPMECARISYQYLHNLRY